MVDFTRKPLSGGVATIDKDHEILDAEMGEAVARDHGVESLDGPRGPASVLAELLAMRCPGAGPVRLFFWLVIVEQIPVVDRLQLSLQTLDVANRQPLGGLRGHIAGKM